MRRLQRLALSPEAQRLLEARTRQVKEAPEQEQPYLVEQLWSRKDNAAFREIRETLRAMAPGLERCMYCEDSAGGHIDHFWPKARYPLKAFEWLNYLLACSHCNSNYKRDDFPVEKKNEVEVPLLFDPTADDPVDHLELSPLAQGKFKHLTPKGEESIRVFGLNRGLLERGRDIAWRGVERLLMDYDDACARADWRRALNVQKDLCQSPFSGVLVWFMRLVTGPHVDYYVERRHLDRRVVAILEKYPEIKAWL